MLLYILPLRFTFTDCFGFFNTQILPVKTMGLFGCPPPSATPHLRQPRRDRLVFGSVPSAPRHRLWLPSILRLVFCFGQRCGCHHCSQHKNTPQLWRQNSSPHFRRYRCGECGEPRADGKSFGGATTSEAGYGGKPNNPYPKHPKLAQPKRG